MKLILRLVALFSWTGLFTQPVMAESLVQQWQQGLNGAKLTSYSGSVILNNCTLTTIDFSSNGRYPY